MRFLIARLTGTISAFACLTLAVAAPAAPLFRSGYILYVNTIGNSGGNAQATAIGDFNGDGLPDLVTAPFGSIASIHFSNGDRTFGPPVTFTDAHLGQVDYMWTADLNLDGKADLVWSDGYKVFVACGHGNGSFDPSHAIDTVNASSIGYATAAIGDVNGDGKPDIAAPRDTLGLAIYLGNGDGTFAAPIPMVSPHETYIVTLADVNGDGRLDVLNGSDAAISVMLQNPNGSFAAPIDFGTGAALCLSVADLNGDGHLDIQADFDTYLGAGNGTFVDIGHASDIAPVVTLGDVNGDGQLDQLGPGFNFKYVYVALGHGDGTFGPTRQYNSTVQPWGLAAADLDGDGRCDVSVVSWGPPESAVYFGNSDGTLGNARNFPGPAGGSRAIGVGDLDGDGTKDVVTAESGQITAYHGLGAAEFNAGVSYPNTGSTRFVLQDLDADGRADVVSPTSGGVNVRLMLPGGVPGPATFWATNAGTCVAVTVADVDGDGVPDLVTCDSTARTVSVLKGHGDGSFFPAINYAMATVPNDVAVGDLDGDGIADLVVASQPCAFPCFPSTNNVSVRLGLAGGGFAPQSDYPLSSNGVSWPPKLVRIGDVDGDGHPDVIALSMVSAYLWTLRGTGTGSLLPATRSDYLGNSDGLAVGDLDGDGRADAAVVWMRSNACTVFRGQANGTLAASLNYGVAGPDFGGSLAIADLDGDGSPDIAVTGLASLGTISILLNMRNSAAVPPRASASAAFALAGARPNPSGRNMEVVFTLTSTNPTILELLDIAGRRVVARQVGTLGVGVHHVSLAEGRPLPPGLYFIRLRSGAQMLSKRVTVLP